MNYPVTCTVCGAPATHKIASPWSNGTESELKTYALCCKPCVKAAFAEAKRRQQDCPTELGESLGVPQVFQRGAKLTHRPELEHEEPRP